MAEVPTATPWPYNRKNPYLAELIRHERLTKSGSGKDTRHFVLKLAGSGLKYTPGDSLAVFARNSPRLVDEIVRLTGFDPSSPVTVKDSLGQPKAVPYHQALSENFILNRATRKILAGIEERIQQGEQRNRLMEIVDNGELQSDYIYTRDYVDVADDVLREAGPKLHEVRVTCSLPCSVGVDGRIGTLEEGTTAVLYLDPGKHELSFGFSRGKSVLRAFDARAGAKDDLAVDAPRETSPPPPQAVPAPSPVPPREAPPRASSGLPPAVFFVGVGLTLAAGAATAISGADTLASPGKDAVREGCVGQGEDCELYKSGLAGELRTNIGLGLTGGLVVVTTVVGLFLTDWGGSSAPPAKTGGLRLRLDGPRLRATF